MSRQEQERELARLQKEYDEFKALGLNLDMSRGKPCKEQLDISNGLLGLADESSILTEEGQDSRNYGGLVGIPEMRRIFSELFGCPVENVIVGENSSLHMMFDCIAQACGRGLDGEKPWLMQGKVKFLCPSPGYDRHFGVTQYFDIENIPVPMTPDGPDMDMVEEYVKDPMVKGIWCVPKYSNPDGYSYSDETVRRLASLKPAANDFRIMWDNAYAVHHLYEDRHDEVLCLYQECLKRGTEKMVLMFMSTSKVTHPGSGVAAMCASKHNVDLIKGRLTFQTIGPDKVNQLRVARFLKDSDGIAAIMKKHAAIIRPKFEIVLREFERSLAPCGAGRWTNPNGGYFISYYAPDGCAKRTVELCKLAGVTTTGAGASYPYGNDPKDSNIRVAPTYPSNEELETAVRLFTVAARIAYLERLLAEE